MVLLGHLVLCGAAISQAGESFERAGSLAASEVAPSALLEGEHYRLASEVVNDGYMNTYTIVSDYGSFQAYGDDMLRARVREVQALAALSEVSKTDAFVTSLTAAATNPFQTARAVVDKPVETLAGIPKGVGRFLRRSKYKIERGVERAEEELDELRADDPSDTAAGGDRDVDLAGEVEEGTKRYLGYHRVKRQWARRLGIDPYTTNPVVQAELDRIAWAAFAGGFAAKSLVPSIGVVSDLGAVNELVWETDPADLERLNRERLAAMGVEEEVVRAFLRSPAWPASRLTATIAALSALPQVAGRASFFRLAVDAESEEEAIFFQGSARMLAAYHREVAGLAEIVTGARRLLAAGVTAERALVFALPLDHLLWTEDIAALAPEVASFGGADTRAHELWVAGRVSQRARQALETAGWRVHQGARQRWLDVTPRAKPD